VTRLDVCLKERTWIIDWAEAAVTANLFRNRSPTKILQFKTPYELFHQTKPIMKGIRTFGCRVQYRNNDPSIKKLDDRSFEGMLLGFDEKAQAYKIIDMESQAVVISKDVKFFENKEAAQEHTYLDPKQVQARRYCNT